MASKSSILPEKASQLSSVFSSTILTLFTEKVKNTPKQNAATFMHQQISYQDLDKKSSLLASQLISYGAKPGILIPIWLDRSLEWLTAVIAVLKTGAAYIPIDPAYPIKRVEYILTDAKTSLLITNSKNAKILQHDYQTEIVILDHLEELKGEHGVLSLPETDLQDLAYVIYTSGSTGKPKGVMISHESIKT